MIDIAIRAALTGHLVFSTLHTNDAAGSITRLLDMGVEDFLLTSTINAVLAQRLVRTLCPDCRLRQPLDEYVEESESRGNLYAALSLRMVRTVVRLADDDPDAARRERLYTGTMLARGRQALDVTTARYAAGQASFRDLIEARRTLLDLELSSLRASADRRLAWNDLITLLGTEPGREEG